MASSGASATWFLETVSPFVTPTEPNAPFRVTGRQEAPKQQLPAALFSRAGPPRLALITCGGRFDQTTRHYRNNVFITATPE